MGLKAYIIIDLQNEYFAQGNLTLRNIEEAGAKAARFLEFARNHDDKFKIIHVRHVFPKEAGAPFFIDGTPGAEINDIVKPLENEQIITKNHPNSFVDTNLDAVLKKNGITELIISGAMTNVCIQGTARHASEIGYKVTILKDAVTTKDWEFEGKTVSFEEVNTAIFATLAFGSYANLVNTEDAIASL